MIAASFRARAVAAAFAPTAHRFRLALRDPAQAQSRVLAGLVRRAALTDYGRHYRVRTADDFLGRLPITDYDTLLPWITRQKRDEGRALTADRVLFYERTSGSSGPSKDIPYTAALRRSFTRMFAIWAHDLLANGPRFRTGGLYFSVSPTLSAAQATPSGVPIGLDDDADYLGPWLKALLSPFFIGPPFVRGVRDPEAFKRAVASALVAAPHLEIISIWNPSFLRVILDTIEANKTELGARLAGARRAALYSDPVDWRALWPELKLVSCWSSAAAEPLAHALRARLPHVLVQGKGLLATEAPMTIPLVGESERDNAGVPLVDEVYFEFERDGDTRTYSLHELTQGETYGIIVSQKGGLLRYRMGDRVRVSGTALGTETPRLEFVGRGGAVSDLVGEKLHEDQVATAIGTLGLGPAVYATLVPARAPIDHYVLVVEAAPAALLVGLAGALDAALRRSYHYDHARLLGQLDLPRVVIAPRVEEVARALQIRRGMKWGDVKPRALVTGSIAAELLREVLPP